MCKAPDSCYCVGDERRNLAYAALTEHYEFTQVQGWARGPDSSLESLGDLAPQIGRNGGFSRGAAIVLTLAVSALPSFLRLGQAPLGTTTGPFWGGQAILARRNLKKRIARTKHTSELQCWFVWEFRDNEVPDP